MARQLTVLIALLASGCLAVSTEGDYPERPKLGHLTECVVEYSCGGQARTWIIPVCGANGEHTSLATRACIAHAEASCDPDDGWTCAAWCEEVTVPIICHALPVTIPDEP